MIRLSLIIGFLFLAAIAQGEPMIIDARKTLPMSDNDKVYRDFYINGGTKEGLQEGMVVTVTRAVPLYDTYQNRNAGELQLKVARLKIIHAQDGLAVGRLHASFSRDQSPLVEDNFIMIGDRIDLRSATADKNHKSGMIEIPVDEEKKQAAAVTEEKSEKEEPRKAEEPKEEKTATVEKPEAKPASVEQTPPASPNIPRIPAELKEFIAPPTPEAPKPVEAQGPAAPEPPPVDTFPPTTWIEESAPLAAHSTAKIYINSVAIED